MSDISIPGGRIRSFVERIEHIDTELQELNESKKEVFSEAKAEGFDVKVLKEILRLRDRLNEILAKHCGRKIEEVVHDTDRDNFMSAEEAAKWGLVDQVVQSRKEIPAMDKPAALPA